MIIESHDDMIKFKSDCYDTLMKRVNRHIKEAETRGRTLRLGYVHILKRGMFSAKLYVEVSRG